MAWTFGDSFDLYTATADMTAGYWDSGTLNASLQNTFGRFQARGSISNGSGGGLSLVKSSGSNDAIHHIVVAFNQTAVISGTNLGFNFQLQDGATTQCSIVFRSDGAILLTSGGPTGTVLATYVGAFTSTNIWYAFEIEVVINNTTGSMTVRKNGNTGTADFTLGSLNTRTTTNNYANRLAISGQNIVSVQFLDDLLWRSDPSSVAWVGDIRCYTRMPTSDQSVQFTPNPQSTVGAVGAGIAFTAGTARYTVGTAGNAAVALCDCTINTVVLPLTAGYTGNMKCALFAMAGNTVGALLATATPITNPVSGNNTFTFPTPPAIAKGTSVVVGFCSDTTTGTIATYSNINQGGTSATAYSAFPVSSPSINGGQNVPTCTINYTPTNNNSLVNEAQQDGTTSYVLDSTVGHADFYGIASIPVTPVATIAVMTRAFAQKSDAGARSGAVQLKSGSTTVTSPSTALTTSWGWLWRTDVNDPATSAPWTATGVNNAQVGPTVTT